MSVSYKEVTSRCNQKKGFLLENVRRVYEISAFKSDSHYVFVYGNLDIEHADAGSNSTGNADERFGQRPAGPSEELLRIGRNLRNADCFDCN